MKNTDLLQAIGQIDPLLIAEAAPDTPKERIANKTWIKWASFAACFLFLVLVCWGTVAEAKEYREAVQFFHAYNLSTEGLTRSEIKRIYRDITTESFAYTKTAEVLTNSVTSNKIPGLEIPQQNPTTEDMETLWNYLKENGKSPHLFKDGVHYWYRTEYTEEGSSHDYFEKYDGDQLLWSVLVSEFDIQGYSIVSDGVIAYGETTTSSDSHYPWIAKFDEQGNSIWKRMMINGFDDEYISAVVENPDGSYAVFSRGDLNYFSFNQYTKDGEKIHSQKTEIGNYRIVNAARFEDGYLMQLGNYTNEPDKIVKVDSEGTMTELFTYRSNDRDYYITDMIEFKGNIYLSAYAVPKLEDESENAGGRHEIAPVLNYLFDNGIYEISSEELTPMLRKNYTAMLLVCNPKTGTPKKFYSADGSLGGELSVSESGKLLWNVENITTSEFSPATSSYTIAAACYEYRYTFNGFGWLIRKEKTGEITTFAR